MAADRPAEDRAAVEEGRLYGAAVIDVLPVGLDQAQAFLLAEQLQPRRRRWQQVIDHLRAHPDSVAARTLTTPLALTLARDTYTRADPADLLDTQAHPTPEALLQHLLARSLTLAYPDPAEHQRATWWLSWIARHMGTSRELRWWDIPTWIPRWQIGLVAGLGAGVGVGVEIGVEFRRDRTAGLGRRRTSSARSSTAWLRERWCSWLATAGLTKRYQPAAAVGGCGPATMTATSWSRRGSRRLRPVESCRP